jgi:lysophospholipase L1-like esterase
VRPAACFASLAGPVAGPDYDQFHPIIHPSCAGTHHQDIEKVERLVFLGDSVAEGTPPTLPWQYFRSLVAAHVTSKFGAVEVSDCAKWGAKMDDLLQGGLQIPTCFPNAVEPKRTLVVMVMGGNDISTWAKDQLDPQAATAQADISAGLLRDAVHWLKDPQRFPNGSYVIFSNVYEYTDTSGDLLSCPAASLAGFKQNWPQGAPAIKHYEEQFMQVAVETKSDMLFLLEHFCGHGYKRDDPSLQCYRGPNTPLWFDLTCIHPNPEGHQQIADLFGTIIDG